MFVAGRDLDLTQARDLLAVRFWGALAAAKPGCRTMARKTRDFSLRVNATSLDDAGTFVGLASTHGPPPDLVGDVDEHGAFRQAI
jgi:hypothetical protein